MNLVFDLLDNTVNRNGFACGEAALDRYLQAYALQDMRKNFATVVVARQHNLPETIVGYYTLATASVTNAHIPDDLGRKMPKYPTVPAIRIGRLAVATPFQGRHVGSMLLMNALKRACRSDIAWAIFVVDAKNSDVAEFYRKFQFETLKSSPLSLFLTRALAEKIHQALD